MKRKIHMELLATSALAIVLTLLFAIFIFYGLLREQVIGDLRAEARALKSMHVFDDAGNFRTEYGDLHPGSVRITVIGKNGAILFDSSADAGGMENHADRPEVKAAFETGEGSGTRLSGTLSANLFYYAVRLDNGNVLRISREAAGFMAVFGRLLPIAAGVFLFLFVICIILSGYFTKSLIRPIEEMAQNISGPGIEPAYKELAPLAAEIRRQHDDILKNARMRQEFTANVSHELKTPLTAISGYAELIERGMTDEKDTRRFAGEIHKNAARLLTLINDTIQLSQLDSGENTAEFTDVDLYRLAADCVGSLQLNAENMDVTMKLLGEPAVIRADRQLMEELLYNLCDNAIRYNDRGGSVTVTVGKDEGGKVFLDVKDTGIGIPPKHQDRVFERFYRVDKSRSKATGGTGLGLAIVKHIVERHNAQIALESEPGKGTDIRVTFP